MKRISCLLLLVLLAGCAPRTVEPPAPPASQAAATPAVDPAVARNRAIAAHLVDEANRLMSESRYEDAVARYFQALDRDPSNDRALAGVKIAHDRMRVPDNDLLPRYEQMLKVVAQYTRDEIDARLNEATRAALQANWKAAAERLAGARIELDSNTRAFSGGEIRSLAERIDDAAESIDRAHQRYDRYIQQVREQELQRLRMEQQERRDQPWVTYEY